jgi:hypothetical protein
LAQKFEDEAGGLFGHRADPSRFAERRHFIAPYGMPLQGQRFA